MGKKKRKVLKIILIVITSILAGGFFANWYLKNKLEDYLKDALSEEVSQATDGFYDMQFDDLSVSFFDGSLLIENVRLTPDSAIFRLWAAKDSLPSTYFKMNIKSIHFEGINLTWRFNYKKLNFKLFEIKNPTVEIFDSQYSDKFEKKTKNTSDKPLYELISPYIDVLSVKKMNLEHANITYTAFDNQGNSVYSLKDVSFHAYRFRLDENSSESGKLLYCDDFDFITNQQQVLLSNNQFVFNTDKIELSTKDSIVNIEKIDLIPQKSLWEQSNRVPDSYVESTINSINLRGISFNRENALSNLKVRLFEIANSDIKYFNYQADKNIDTRQKSNKKKDPVILSWTLYAMVSPLLNSIVIDKIEVSDARLQYTDSIKDRRDVYRLDNFNFEAYRFKVDPEADKERRFMYSEGFAIDAKGISGEVNSKNQRLKVGQLLLNTVLGRFQIKDINLEPVTTQTQYDYISGTIDSITVTGIKYEQGVSLEYFSVDAPKVEYVKMPSKKTVQEGDHEQFAVDNPLQNLDIITPFADHLKIGYLALNNANIRFKDKRIRGGMDYYLPKIDFNATNLLLNKETIANSATYVTLDDFKLAFDRFDNLLPGKDYRLKIREGFLSGGTKGRLYLRNVELIPQEKTWSKSPDIYFGLVTPLIDVRNIDYSSLKKDEIRIASFNLMTPRIKIIKERNPAPAKQRTDERILPFDIALKSAGINDLSLIYIDKQVKDTIQVLSKSLTVDASHWNAGEGMTIDKIALLSPDLTIRKSGNKHAGKTNVADDKTGKHTPSIKIGEVSFANVGFNLAQPDLGLGLSTNNMSLHGLMWDSSIFRVGSFMIDKPSVKIDQTLRVKESSKGNHKPQAGIYEQLAGIAPVMEIDNFNISEASVDYKSGLPEKKGVQQKLNTTTLLFKGLNIDNRQQEFTLDDIEFRTKDLRLPVDNGFYTLKVGDVELSKSKRLMQLSHIHLEAAYSKTDFAYHHPKHKDWFDVRVGDINLSEIDMPGYFSNKVLRAKRLGVKDVSLLNYKNQNIEIEHNIMPLIYEGLHKLPVKFDIDSLDVRNFNVEYEELAKNGTTPGKIFFTGLNGRMSGFTNLSKKPDHYMDLHADGWLMGAGRFTAQWVIPVDSLNDHFGLRAHLTRFDLQELNRLITPLAPAQIESGIVRDLRFATNASSKGASIDMTFLYNDLRLKVLKNQDGQLVENKLISKAANAVLKRDNPDIKRGKPKKPRQVHSEIVRDPYHSTFNYFWQILQPPVVESVGVSQGKQNFMKKVATFIGKVKGLFSKKKSHDKDNKEHD